MSLDKSNNDNMFCSNNYWNSISKKMMMYEEELEKKEQFINQLKQNLNEQKAKCYSYEVEFKNIKKQYTKFQEGKDKLSGAINILKGNLISYEEQIKKLEEVNSMKEAQIEDLKNQILELEDIIAKQKDMNLSLKEEIQNLRTQVDTLTSKLSIVNSKSVSTKVNKNLQESGRKISYFR